METFSLLFFSVTIFPLYALAARTLLVNQTIRDGQTIVSPNQTFELGFFSPGNASENRYIGIWFKRLATGTITWVANRETPIRNSSGELTLHSDGVLVLRDSATDRVIWSSNTNRKSRNPVARLLDTGNFVVTDDGDDPEEYIWQSFDHFGNTQLPGMKFGRNFEKGIVTNFTSWKSVDDPSHGPYMVYMDFNGLPQLFHKKGDVIHYRLGSWNGLAFTGRPRVSRNSIYKLEYVSNEREVYSSFELIKPTVLSKLVLIPEGKIERFSWTNRKQGWTLLSSPQSDTCDMYALCGPYGSCDIEQSPPCGCFKGFTPKRPNQWNLGDWYSGCEREISLECGVGEGFRKYSFLKLPDTRQSWFDRNMTIEQCERKCKSECNCTAYATLDIKYGTGCLLWNNELMDMRTFSGEGQDIYIRMAAAELDKDRKASTSGKKMWIIIIPFVVGLAILLGFFLLIIWKMKQKAQGRHDAQNKDVDIPLLSLSTLLSATNNFSENNKIGQGGFGPVYKGYLEDGLEVAVKRLSESSTQGDEEFKNEVIFISKLQHRNLVKILGWCIEGREKLLVYEYMSNKGLDLFIYEDKSNKLDWSQRFHILHGISRGLLYLHQDSRLRIIHRDLKAANILLDEDMNPKISDFGIARSFKENETETNTKQVIGTYGYMSPEYAQDGVISVKSDIFSFGVMVLEIVSGRKNRGFFHQDHSHNLVGHAWKLYKEGKTLELVDTYSVEASHMLEVLRSIQVGLLCVQNNPDERPDMSDVVLMLSGQDRLPEPKQPGFYQENSYAFPTNMETQCSNNDVTLTLLEAR